MGPLLLFQEDDSLAEPFLQAVSNLGDSNLDGPHEWLLQSLEPLLSVAFPPVLANLDASYLNASYLDASYLDDSNLDDSNLNASYLNASYLDASNLNASNLNASNLNASNLNASNLDASYLNASYLDASYLAANSFDFLQQEPAAKWKTGRRPVPSKFEKEIASRMLMSELPSVTYMKRKAVVDTLFSDTFREVSMAWSSVALHLKTLGMSKDYVRVFYPPPPLLLLLSSSSFSLLPFHHYLHDNRSRR